MTPSDSELGTGSAPPARRNIRIEVTADDTPLLSLRLPAFASAAAWAWRFVSLALFILATVFALAGNQLLFGPPGTAASSKENLDAGAPWLALAFVIWLLGELLSSASVLRAGWHGLGRAGKRHRLLRLLPAALWMRGAYQVLVSMSAENAVPLLREAAAWSFTGLVVWFLIEAALGLGKPRPLRNERSAFLAAEHRRRLFPLSTSRSWKPVLGRRMIIFALAVLSSAALWANTSGNRMPPPVMALWLVCALLWSLAFAPARWSFFEWAVRKIDALRRVRWPKHWWAILAFVVIMGFAAYFRLSRLDTVPLDMDGSDIVEDILAARSIAQGEFSIMVLYGEAREPIHMYLIALLAQLPGLGFDHFTIKLAAAVTSLMTVPVFFWMGYELMGNKDRRLGLAMALMLSALVAVSYWHVVISRYAMRTHLTALAAAIVMVYLARGIRYNRRSDFIKLGLALGFGMYTYTSSRMLPFVALAGVGLALVIRPLTWQKRLAYLVNLGVAGALAFMVFLPMYHASLDYPTEFSVSLLKNTFGTSLGEPIVIDDQWISGFMSNFRDVLLMFNWIGDGNWRHSAPMKPTLDILSGAFLILGVAAWTAHLARNRHDPVMWLMPIMILIMLLPSVLAVWHSATNPSNTRISGAMPGIYVLIALPILTLAFRLFHFVPGAIGKAFGMGFCAVVLLLSFQQNAYLYFDLFANSYRPPPYQHAGRLMRALAESDVPWGNIIIIPYAHFWDERNVYVEAGQPGHTNVVWLAQVTEYLANASPGSAEFGPDPTRDLVFLYSPNDEETSAQLKRWFPRGRELLIESYLPKVHRSCCYKLFRASGLG